jgi:hypothetical protein
MRILGSELSEWLTRSNDVTELKYNLKVSESIFETRADNIAAHPKLKDLGGQQ